MNKIIWEPENLFEIEYVNYCQIPNHGEYCTKKYVITDIREADLHNQFE